MSGDILGPTRGGRDGKRDAGRVLQQAASFIERCWSSPSVHEGCAYQSVVAKPAWLSRQSARPLNLVVVDRAPRWVFCKLLVICLLRHLRLLRGTRAKWTHWDLNPGPSACEADVIPLHHVPHAPGHSKQVSHSVCSATITRQRLEWKVNGRSRGSTMFVAHTRNDKGAQCGASRDSSGGRASN